MYRSIAMLFALAMMAIPAPAGATHDCQNDPNDDHCSGASACRRGQGWVASPEVDTTTIGGAYYVDIDVELMPDPFLFSVWIYEESNGIEGLQRADAAVDMTCGGHLGLADTLIW